MNGRDNGAHTQTTGRLASNGWPLANAAMVSAEAGARHNIPTPLTTFVGREQDVAEVKRLLATTRLLTLTGAGGIGKTRLALETTADLVNAYAGGVRLIPMASLADPALIVQAVAAAVGVRTPAHEGLLEALLDALRLQEMLLILDNCEHLATACAGLAETLLTGCPRLQILITSRQALGISGETVWRVPTLTVPRGEHLSHTDHGLNITPDAEAQVEQFGSVRLFLDRARAALPGFELTVQNNRAIVSICQQLDGVPLAIELAAARVGLLSAEQIAARLADRFRLLTSGSLTALPQHQTLRALVDWSYDLLAEREQILLRRLSVFAGGWTLEGAELVCPDQESLLDGEALRAGGPSLCDADQMLDILGQLLMKSLVVAEEWRGEVRYSLLQTIRQYGVERLRASGEEAALRERHLRWLLTVAEQTTSDVDGPDAADRLARLEVEHDNFRAALDWSLTAPDVSRSPAEHGSREPAGQVGLRLAAALHSWWSLRGFQSEGREWLSKLLARQPGRTVARARALSTAGYLALRQGDSPAALDLLDEGLTLGQELADGWSIAALQQNLGLVRHAQRDYTQAARHFQEGLSIARAQGLNARTQSLALYLADLTSDQGDSEHATIFYAECLALAQATGNSHNIGAASRGLGQLALVQDDLARAVPLLEESLERSHALHDRKCTPMGVEALAFAAVRQGRPERAIRLFGAAQALRDVVPVTLPPAQRDEHERGLRTLRIVVDEQRFLQLWAEGQAMSPDQVTAYALAPLEPRPVEPACATVRPRQSLTSREWEVASLIAQGLTSRQIAERLVISVRTADAHAAHIREKLGLHSRAQIAAWVVEHDRLKSPSFTSRHPHASPTERISTDPS